MTVVECPDRMVEVLSSLARATPFVVDPGADVPCSYPIVYLGRGGPSAN